MATSQTVATQKPLEDPLAHLPCSSIVEYKKGQMIYNQATNRQATLRGDEESACAHKLDNPQLSRKAPIELTADATTPHARGT
jgi:hypothetical protein